MTFLLSSPVLRPFFVPLFLSPASHFYKSLVQCRPEMGCKWYGPGWVLPAGSSLTEIHHSTEYTVLSLSACWCLAWKDGLGSCFPKGCYNIQNRKIYCSLVLRSIWCYHYYRSTLMSITGFSSQPKRGYSLNIQFQTFLCAINVSSWAVWGEYKNTE